MITNNWRAYSQCCEWHVSNESAEQPATATCNYCKEHCMVIYMDEEGEWIPRKEYIKHE
tara:strand:+ start:321 stop:497 length:177 start_codon:yes stop_codon:yes gene_type:complete